MSSQGASHTVDTGVWGAEEEWRKVGGKACIVEERERERQGERERERERERGTSSSSCCSGEVSQVGESGPRPLAANSTAL